MVIEWWIALRQSCFYISLLFPVRLQQVAQVRIVFYAQELAPDDVAHLFLDAVVIALYFFLHMVLAVFSREVRDDGYRFVRPRLGFHPHAVHHDPGVEYFLLDGLSEIVRYASHEHPL